MSASGIESVAGQRVVKASVRPNGTVRKGIKIRPGYLPAEDRPKYKVPALGAWTSKPAIAGVQAGPRNQNAVKLSSSPRPDSSDSDAESNDAGEDSKGRLYDPYESSDDPDADYRVMIPQEEQMDKEYAKWAEEMYGAAPKTEKRMEEAAATRKKRTKSPQAAGQQESTFQDPARNGFSVLSNGSDGRGDTEGETINEEFKEEREEEEDAEELDEGFKEELQEDEDEDELKNLADQNGYEEYLPAGMQEEHLNEGYNEGGYIENGEPDQEAEFTRDGRQDENAFVCAGDNKCFVSYHVEDSISAIAPEDIQNGKPNDGSGNLQRGRSLETKPEDNNTRRSYQYDDEQEEGFEDFDELEEEEEEEEEEEDKDEEEEVEYVERGDDVVNSFLTNKSADDVAGFPNEGLLEEARTEPQEIDIRTLPQHHRPKPGEAFNLPPNELTWVPRRILEEQEFSTPSSGWDGDWKPRPGPVARKQSASRQSPSGRRIPIGAEFLEPGVLKSKNVRSKKKKKSEPTGEAGREVSPSEPAPGAHSLVTMGSAVSIDNEKKARNLRKKIRQATAFVAGKEKGEVLLPEQVEKANRLGELQEQLKALNIED